MKGKEKTNYEEPKIIMLSLSDAITVLAQSKDNDLTLGDDWDDLVV